MSIFEVGRLCVKIAGRDAGNKCVVVEQIDDTYVLVDGNVRRKKVNLKHLEPLAEVLEVGKGSHEDVKKAFDKLKLTVWEKKSKERKERPKKQKKKSEKVVEKKEAKVEKKAPAKEEKAEKKEAKAETSVKESSEKEKK